MGLRALRWLQVILLLAGMLECNVPGVRAERPPVLMSAVLSDRMRAISLISKPGARVASLQTSSDYLYVDPLYGYRLRVPAGWYIYPTPADALYGAAMLANYDLEAAEAVGPATLPSNAVRLQIGVTPLPSGQSFDDWTAKWVDFEVNNESVRDWAPTATVPQRHTLGLAGEGTGFRLEGGPGGLPVDVRAFPGSGQVVVAGVSPADSSAAAVALDMLGNLQVDAGHTFPPEVQTMARTLAAASQPASPVQRQSVSAQGTCPAGTFPGDEAPSSPLTLYMPFLSGETWTVGGAGSFYGNGAHCNSNNDYYATDWNRTGDYGAVVLPVADGTVSASVEPTSTTQIPPACPTSGYGCYVQIDHDSSLRTLYGHLSGVYRTSGTVSHTEPIGLVGSTGNSTGSHLHLRFQEKSGGSYYSRCYNGGSSCPNGESSSSPQSPRPSPMLSASGSQALQDGVSYTSNNAGSACPVVSGRVILYDGVDCSGNIVSHDDTGLWKLELETSFNDLAKSIAIPERWSVRLYLDDSESSASVCIPATTTDLQSYQFSDGQTAEGKATWVNVIDGQDCAMSQKVYAPNIVQDAE